jgi:4-amino-4-deoxy-L-arabinose transferase-like glycosyltransferase
MTVLGSRFIVSSFFVLVVVLAIPHFLFLDADFPAGITWSGVLYTDEGWYLNGAVRYVLTGHWYLPGDFNPMVILPIGPLIQASAFHVLGLDLVSARLTVAFVSILIIVLSGFIVWRLMDRTAAMVSSMLLAVNFFFFSFSRIALLELIAICFAVAAIAVALLPDTTRIRSTLIISSLLLVLGVLTKTMALCALPSLIMLAWWKGTSRHDSMKNVILVMVSFALALTAYYFTMMSLYPDDCHYFMRLNIYSRTGDLTILERMHMGLNLLVWIRMIDGISWPVLGLLALFFLICEPKFRRNRLVLLSMTWLFTYLLMMCALQYHPPRYFLPFLFPVFALFGSSWAMLYHRVRGTIFAIISRHRSLDDPGL